MQLSKANSYSFNAANRANSESDQYGCVGTEWLPGTVSSIELTRHSSIRYAALISFLGFIAGIAAIFLNVIAISRGTQSPVKPN